MTALTKLRRILALLAAVLLAWMLMQAIHEIGHVLGAWMTGGRVTHVVVHPLTISRTDVEPNPHPLVVVWAGPIFGVLAPLAIWQIAKQLAARIPDRLLQFLQFFAGFCLVANGAYVAFGSIDGVGDCGVMLRHGTPPAALWAFGAVTIPVGLWLLDIRR